MTARHEGRWGRRVVSAGAAMGLLALTRAEPLPLVLALWYLLLVGQMVLLQRTVALGVLFVSLTLYGTTAWLALEYGGRLFDPWPSRATVLTTTTDDLAAILIAYALVELVVGAERVQAAVEGASAFLRERAAGPGGVTADFAAALVLACVGAADVARVIAIGPAQVLAGTRREYAEELLLGSNHNVQVLVMAATIHLVTRAIAGRGRVLGWSLTALAWTPFLLAGSRKEAIVTGVVCVLLQAPVLDLRRRLLLAAGAALVFVSPTLRSGDVYDSLHEFILPQYMHFAIAMGLVPSDLGGGFAARAWLLVPSIIRPVPVSDFGQEFAALGITGVGVGASPFGEAALNDFWHSTPLSFAVVLLAAVLVVTLGARRFPAVTVVGFGLLVVYGRSDFWTFLFFALAIAAVVTLLAAVARAEPAPAPVANGVPDQVVVERSSPRRRDGNRSSSKSPLSSHTDT